MNSSSALFHPHDSLPISSARTICPATFAYLCAVVLCNCPIFSGVQFRFLSLFVALWNSLKRAAQTLPGLAPASFKAQIYVRHAHTDTHTHTHMVGRVWGHVCLPVCMESD